MSPGGLQCFQEDYSFSRRTSASLGGLQRFQNTRGHMLIANWSCLSHNWDMGHGSPKLGSHDEGPFHRIYGTWTTAVQC